MENVKRPHSTAFLAALCETFTHIIRNCYSGVMHMSSCCEHYFSEDTKQQNFLDNLTEGMNHVQRNTLAWNASDVFCRSFIRVYGIVLTEYSDFGTRSFNKLVHNTKSQYICTNRNNIWITVTWIVIWCWRDVWIYVSFRTLRQGRSQ